MSIEGDAADPSGDAADEPMDDARALAAQFGEAITDLPEYEAFAAAKEDVEADEAAQERISEFERIREEFVLARQTGDADEEALQNLRAAQNRLHELPVMRTYLEAQNELELKLNELNDVVSEQLALDFAEKAGGCCADDA